MHDEEVADDGDDQLGHPVAAAAERILFNIFVFLFIFFIVYYYLRRVHSK